MNDIAKLVTDVRKVAASLNEPLENIHRDLAKLPPVLARAVPCPKPELPSLDPSALAFTQMHKLAQLMGDRSAATYARLVSERKDVLIAEIKELAVCDEDVGYEIGQRLFVLKKHDKPKGLAWEGYLKDKAMPWGRSRADDYIRMFKGMTTALEIKEKRAVRDRRYRAKLPSTTASRSLKSKENSGSACDINWENHRESPTETGAHIRKRAVDWQLYEAVRLAEEFALCRPGTERREITLTIVRKINGVIKAWKKLHAEMLAKAGK